MDPLQVVLKKFQVEWDGKQKLPIDLINAVRGDLGDLFKDLEYKVGAEIGVEQGIFSESLLRKNPDLKLFSIDAWTAYRGYRDHVSQSKMDGFYEKAVQRMKEFGSRSEIVKGFSSDIVKKFKDKSLDFVYIDGNHSFDYVMVDIIEWSRKVRSGGIIAGHDFIRRLMEPVHVIQATQVYTYCHKIAPWFTVGGATKETRSFFWIKP